jgi:hypothetical protein
MSPEGRVASLDELELALRRLPSVVSVGFAEHDDLLVVEVQALAGAAADLARSVTLLANQQIPGRVAVEVVRWGDGAPGAARLALVEVTTDLGAGDVTVRVARGDESALGRGPTAHGLLGAVEATVRAVRTFTPELALLPGWARTIETTPARRFLVAASLTDPATQDHRRGLAEGATPIEGAARATLAALNRGPAPE